MESYFTPCPRGLESALDSELAAIGATGRTTTDGGVAFEGGIDLMYRANLASRIASRVLWRMGAGGYRNEDDLYGAARAIAWEARFGVQRTIRVNVSATRAPVKSLEFIALKVKDAVCDRFRAAVGSRPSVDTRHPDVRIHVFLDDRQATFYLDTSGEPLFKRGYRADAGEAPLRENLAAGILALAGWTPGTPLLDPMCGGGTLLLEAAAMTRGLAPGANRGFAFERLADYDPRLWRGIREASAPAGGHPEEPLIHGSDNETRSLEAARAALERAGLASSVRLAKADVLEVEPPAGTGILVSNPPYGMRLGDRDALAKLYPRLGDMLKRRFPGWRCHFLSADTRLPKLIGLKPTRRVPLFNGPIECRLYEFPIVAGPMQR